MDDQQEMGGGTGTISTVDFAALSVADLVGFRDTPTFQAWIAEVPSRYQERLTGYIDALLEHVPAD